MALHDTQPSNRDRAIAYCEREEAFYRRASTLNYRRWRFLQFTVILMGAVGMIVAPLNSIPADWTWIRGMPAAFATFASALLAGFNLQRTAIAQIIASSTLCGERVSFEARCAPYSDPDDQRNLDCFVGNVRRVIDVEIKGFADAYAPRRHEQH